MPDRLQSPTKKNPERRRLRANGEEGSPARTLQEWHGLIQRRRHRKKWREANWKAKKKWIRRAIWRVATLRPMRRWWDFARALADEYAEPVEKHSGRSRSEQLRQMSLLAFQHGASPKVTYGISPEQYYKYRLYRPTRFPKRDQYLYKEPGNVLNDHLTDLTRGVVTVDLTDKRSWFEWALERGVPGPRPIASFEGGSVTPWQWNGTPSDLPEMDLFSIRADRFQGKGAEHWRWDGNRYLAQADSGSMSSPVRLSSAELIDRLSKRSEAEGPMMLQKRARNHPKMQKFTTGALATCRLVTGRFPGEEPEPVAASFKMPRGNAIVDNMSDNSIVAPVDLRTGRLGPAVSGFPELARERFRKHPGTGAQIDGAMLPCWDDLVALSVDAHRKLPNVPFVGWDLTLAESGPMIVEPNDGSAAPMVEVPGGVPLSNTPYEAMYDAWMQALMPEAGGEEPGEPWDDPFLFSLLWPVEKRYWGIYFR